MALKSGAQIIRRNSSFIVLLSSFKLALAVVLMVSGEAARAQTGPLTKSTEQGALRRGQEALKNGDMRQARKEFEKAVRLAPNDALAQGGLGWVLAQQGDSEAAIPHLRAALKRKPGYFEARLTLAGVLAQQGKSVEAEQEARAAVKEAPSNAEAHRTLARILNQRSGDEALSEMRQAVELDRQRADLADELGMILAQRNQLS